MSGWTSFDILFYDNKLFFHSFLSSHYSTFVIAIVFVCSFVQILIEFMCRQQLTEEEASN